VNAAYPPAPGLDDPAATTLAEDTKLNSTNVPDVYPLAVGLKTRGSWMLAPGLIFTGSGKLPNEKALPCSDLEAIRNVLFPVLVSSME